MDVFAVEAVGHFVGMGLADHVGARGEQSLDGRRGMIGGRMRLEPNRIAIARAVSGNVEHVLDAETASPQRAAAAALERHVGMPAERV